MQFATILALAVALATQNFFVAAAPSPEAAPVPGPSLEARAAEAQGHLYICTEGGFAGECTNYAVNNNQCTNFPSSFNNQISSMGPDQGWVCVTYVNDNCDGSGETYTVSSPGFSSLPSGIDNALSSVECYQT